MRDAPGMRASHLKSNLEALAQLGPESERRIREEVADVVQTVEAASRVAWLPLELDVKLTGAVERTCGRERMKRWCRDAILRTGETSLLRPVRVGLQALGMTPQAALRRVPYGWTLVYHGCGELHYEHAGEREVVLRHENVPQEMLESEGYLEGVAGALEGVIEVGGGRNASSVVERELDARCVRYVCRWS